MLFSRIDEYLRAYGSVLLSELTRRSDGNGSGRSDGTQHRSPAKAQGCGRQKSQTGQGERHAEAKGDRDGADAVDGDDDVHLDGQCGCEPWTW